MKYAQVESPIHPRSQVDLRIDRADDSELVHEAKFGGSAAFQELYERHHTRIFRTTFRILRQKEDAEDAVQVAFQQAFANLTRFRQESSFATWLTRIAVNEALMLRRQNRTLMRRSEVRRDVTEYSIVFSLADRSPTPEQVATESERKTALAMGISALRQSLRSTLVLREIEELSTKETAKRLGLSVTAAKARLFQARRRLRKILGKRLQREKKIIPDAPTKFACHGSKHVISVQSHRYTPKTLI